MFYLALKRTALYILFIVLGFCVFFEPLVYEINYVEIRFEVTFVIPALNVLCVNWFK